MQLVFLHGLESGPHGRKGRLLAAAYPTLIAPDCEGVFDVEKRLAIIEPLLAGKRDIVLVGSSFGGLAAIMFAARHMDRVHGLVLCAPAVHWPGAENISRLPPRLVIIHGERDEVIPLAAVQEFALRFPLARLRIVDDDHTLRASQNLMLAEVADLMAQ